MLLQTSVELFCSSLFLRYERAQLWGCWSDSDAVPPQRGESNDLGVWTWLSSRSIMTPDLEPFHILLPAVSQLLTLFLSGSIV